MDFCPISCPVCEEAGLPFESGFLYPSKTLSGTRIVWEHPCPKYEYQTDKDGKAIVGPDGMPLPIADEEGNVIAKPPYSDTYIVP